MRSRLARHATVIIALALVGCAPAASPSPSATTADPSAIVHPSGDASFDAGPSVEPSHGPSAQPPTSSPSARTSTGSTGLPVRDSARELSNHDVLMAPGPEGSLFVLIPSRNGSARLALLDSTGQPRAGWPVELDDVDYCDQLLPVDDGSVRVVCKGPDTGDEYIDVTAFAFGRDGRPFDGWPFEITASFVTGGVTKDVLTLVAVWPLPGVTLEGRPSGEAAVVSVHPDGSSTHGGRVPIGQVCCDTDWAVGPDGAAYAIEVRHEPAESTGITALVLDGILAGWPVTVGGIGISPGFGSDGRIVVAVGSSNGTTRVVAIDSVGTKDASGRLPIRTIEVSGDTGGCSILRPRSPLVADDGTTFVYSELDRSIYAVDGSLKLKSGWPFEPASRLEVARPGLESEHEAGYCPTPVVPGVGPDGALYLALKARNGSVGGSLIAVSPNGRMRPGWPVTLSRPGAEFWSVVVGPDGTAYALAIEPEAGGKSSGSILAIAPDSTVRWTTTIIEP